MLVSKLKKAPEDPESAFKDIPVTIYRDLR